MSDSKSANNTSNGNTSNGNTGNGNTGYRNTGNGNTGNGNTGYRNTGYCNIDEPPVRIFGQETNIKRSDIVFPDFFYFDLIKWIHEGDMTEREKEANPSYVTTGGYLKVREYKQAFIESYEKASNEDRKKVEALPNFDADIFYKISGIRIGEDPKVKITIGDKDVMISRDSYESLKKQLK